MEITWIEVGTRSIGSVGKVAMFSVWCNDFVLWRIRTELPGVVTDGPYFTTQSCAKDQCAAILKTWMRDVFGFGEKVGTYEQYQVDGEWHNAIKNQIGLDGFPKRTLHIFN